jgi:hypothetical protein
MVNKIIISLDLAEQTGGIPVEQQNFELLDFRFRNPQQAVLFQNQLKIMLPDIVVSDLVDLVRVELH